VLKVVPLTGEQVLKAYAKDVPVDPDAAKSTPAVEESALIGVTGACQRSRGAPPTPLIYWGDLSVTGSGDLPLATQRRVESIASDRSPFAVA
jgi:hypothetical protein